jgi:membrane protease YdiL (CAAX protease family)
VQVFVSLASLANAVDTGRMSETPFDDHKTSGERDPSGTPDLQNGFDADPVLPPPLSLLDRWSPARWLVFALILLLLYQMAIVALWNGRGGFGLLGLAAAPVVGIVLPLWSTVRRFGLAFRQEMALDGLSLRQFLGVVLAIAGMLPLAYALSVLNSRYSAPVPEYWEFFEALRPNDAVGFTCGLLAIVVMIPLGEELLFRRIVQGTLLRQLSPVVAIVLSGVLFGAAHMTPWVLLPIAGLGILLGVLNYTSGTITAAWLGHALFNLFSFLELTISGDPDSQDFEAVAVRPLPILLGAAIMLLGIRMCRQTHSDTHSPTH